MAEHEPTIEEMDGITFDFLTVDIKTLGALQKQIVREMKDGYTCAKDCIEYIKKNGRAAHGGAAYRIFCEPVGVALYEKKTVSQEQIKAVDMILVYHDCPFHRGVLRYLKDITKPKLKKETDVVLE